MHGAWKMQNKKINKGHKLLIGAVIDEPGSSERNKTGGWRTFIPIIDQEKCIGCGTCVAVCGENFELKNGKSHPKKKEVTDLAKKLAELQA